MSQIVTTTPKNPQARLFIFSGQHASFPLKTNAKKTFGHEDIIEKNPTVEILPPKAAIDQGYHVVDSLLKRPEIASVTATVTEKPGKHNIPVREDAIFVMLRSGNAWSDTVRGNATQFAGFFKKPDGTSYEKFISDQLMRDFIRIATPPYMNPEDAKNAVQVLQTIDRFIYEQMKADKPLFTVFKTVASDNGGVKPIGFRPDIGELTLQFSGDCKSGCRKGDTTLTRMGLNAVITTKWPFIRNCVYV